MGDTLWRVFCITVGILDGSDLNAHRLGIYTCMNVLKLKGWQTHAIKTIGIFMGHSLWRVFCITVGIIVGSDLNAHRLGIYTCMNVPKLKGWQTHTIQTICIFMGDTLWRVFCIKVGIIDGSDLNAHRLEDYTDLLLAYNVLLYFLNDRMLFMHSVPDDKVGMIHRQASHKHYDVSSHGYSLLCYRRVRVH